MPDYYKSQTYDDAFRQLNDVCNWFSEIGINYNKTRLGEYRRIFEELAQCQHEGKVNQYFDSRFVKGINALHEVAELVRIYEGLHHNNDLKLTSRLQAALRGHELYVLADEDRSGRDFAFELSVAAKFARHGYTIDFSSDADVEVIVEGITFYVECKRPNSINGITPCIKKGLKQLKKRYDTSNAPSEARGILAISIGKTINPLLGRLEGDTLDLLSKNASLYVDSFIRNYRRNWQLNIDSRTLGVLVVLDAPGLVLFDGKLTTIHEVAMNPCIQVGTPDFHWLINLTKNVLALRPD